MTKTRDRNFDDLAERFGSRVYGKRKGRIRQAVIWRDLQSIIPAIENNPSRPLRILDIGGGLGQLSIRLAQLGHNVHYNDISPKMTEKAREMARQAGVEGRIEWSTSPYQSFLEGCGNQFDLILCHALMEWLANPEDLLPRLKPLLKPGGTISLAFYNPAGRIYRNLVFGNFRVLKREDACKTDTKSLTPANPCTPEQVHAWVEASGFEIIKETGIRVFSDYTLEQRGGLQSDDDVLEMELRYSDQEPYRRMGRYLHCMIR